MCRKGLSLESWYSVNVEESGSRHDTAPERKSQGGFLFNFAKKFFGARRVSPVHFARFSGYAQGASRFNAVLWSSTSST